MSAGTGGEPITPIEKRVLHPGKGEKPVLQKNTKVSRMLKSLLGTYAIVVGMCMELPMHSTSVVHSLSCLYRFCFTSGL